MAIVLPITFANLPIGLNSMADFDTQFAAVVAAIEAAGGISLVGTATPDHLVAFYNNGTEVKDSGIALNNAANTFLAGPASGLPANATFRAITSADIGNAIAAFLLALPTSQPATAGQLYWNGGVLSLSQ